MAWRDPTSINWTLGFGEFFYFINEVTLGWVSRLLLMGVYIIVLTGYYKVEDDFTGGMAAAGIAVFVLSFTGWLLDPPFIDWITLAFSMGFMFVGVGAFLLDRNKGTA